MDIVILQLNDEHIRNSGLDNTMKKVLYRNIGRYIAAAETERGLVFSPQTLADSEKSTRIKWDKWKDPAQQI